MVWLRKKSMILRSKIPKVSGSTCAGTLYVNMKKIIRSTSFWPHVKFH